MATAFRRRSVRLAGLREGHGGRSTAPVTEARRVEVTNAMEPAGDGIVPQAVAPRRNRQVSESSSAVVAPAAHESADAVDEVEGSGPPAMARTRRKRAIELREAAPVEGVQRVSGQNGGSLAEIHSPDLKPRAIAGEGVTPVENQRKRRHRGVHEAAPCGLKSTAVISAREAKKRSLLKRTEDGELILPAIGEVEPLWARARASGKYVGAHVSAANGIFQSIVNAVSIKGSAFALFLRPQQQWAAPPLLSETVEVFKKLCDLAKFDPSAHILPHGSYLVNLANSDAERMEKAFETFHDDFVRCERLGILLYNFHPGSAVDGDIPAAIARIAAAINRVHSLTSRTVAVLENSAGQGNSVGSTFEELAAIIDLVEDKGRVGVCLDTAHMWGAGYDISTKEGYDSVMSLFDKRVGFRYLRAMHLNDSKADLNSRKDRHHNLGKGKIGLDAFRFIMNDKRLNGLPLVLETACPPEENGRIWKEEVDLLYSLVEDS